MTIFTCNYQNPTTVQEVMQHKHHTPRDNVSINIKTLRTNTIHSDMSHVYGE